MEETSVCYMSGALAYRPETEARRESCSAHPQITFEGRTVSKSHSKFKDIKTGRVVIQINLTY